MPNRTAAGSIPSTMTYGLLSQRLVATTKRSEAMGHITVFPDSPDAPSPPTRREEPRKDACRASTKDSAGWAGERSHLLLAEGAKFGDRGAPPIEGGRLRQRRKRFTNTASSAI